MPFPGEDDDLELELELDGGEEDLEAAGEAGDEGEGETGQEDEIAPVVQPGQTPSGDESQLRPLSRAERRVQSVVNERNAAKAEAQRLQAELAQRQQREEALQRQMAMQQQQQLAMQQQRAMQQQLEQMSPQDQVAYMMQQQEMRMQQQMMQMQLQTIDLQDRASFEQLQREDPRAAKLKDEVETQLNKMRANGMNASRRDVYAWVLGQRVLAGGKVSKAKAKTAAAGNVRRQTTTPRNARSDTAGGRNKAATFEELEARLSNIPI